ncbi:glycosyl transferase [Rhodococcus sp. ACS1]|uniref:glycosyl transferase n=1 Tax=Rhodococcus sp. ACS1 TaxID=2028570 RepID=UPI000BB0E7A4|nr:glycosyl transferase [Rhodococcus sp. ACS1]PBC45731.1 glycosyl transferase [Rhodococcus sp. ACS1]
MTEILTPVETTRPAGSTSTTARPVRSRFRPHPADVAAVVFYVGLAAFVLARQWKHLGTGYLVRSGQDQTMWEWFFAVAARSLVRLENPLSSDLQNYPLGVNLMGNTAMFGISIPLAPVTLLFGPNVTFTLALTLGLSGTAIAWYWVFSRHVVSSRLAAAVGGGLCGFAPALISHTNGHPNFVALFLLPFIALAVIRLGSGARPVRDGIVLGLLIAYQIFLGEEPLLIYALAFTVFGIAYAASRPRTAFAAVRHSIKGFAVAGGVALAVAAVPLWWQFFGPDSYRAIEHGPVGNDTESFTSFPTSSLAGEPGSAEFSMNATEENAYFGWPLLILLGLSALWLWRMPLARAAAATVAVMGVLSLGTSLTIGGWDTGIPLPWKLISHLPLLESVLESRFAMGCLPAAALLLTLGTDRALASAREGQRTTTLLWVGWLVVALLPLTPTPLAVVQRDAAPNFFADGTWRDYVTDGSVVTVPLPSPENARMLRWQTEQDLAFPIAGGYFVGPAGSEQRGKYGPDDRPTALLLASAQSSGQVPVIDDATRAQALTDLKFWNADVLVLPHTQNDRVLRETVRQLVGAPAKPVDGVWLWDVRWLHHP